MSTYSANKMLEGCRERVEGLALKGKRADNEALTYICAYTQATVDLGALPADKAGVWPWVISLRGYAEVLRALKTKQAA